MSSIWLKGILEKIEMIAWRKWSEMIKRTFWSSRTQVYKGPSMCPAQSMVKVTHKGNLPGTQTPRLEYRDWKLLGKKKKNKDHLQRHENKAGVDFSRASLDARTSQDKVFKILKGSCFLKENWKFYTQLNYLQGIMVEERGFQMREDS